MRWLLRLYPRWWRKRYEGEMTALLKQTGVGPQGFVDLLLGALDARLTGPSWRPWRWGWRALGVAALVIVGGLGIVAAETSVTTWVPTVLISYGGPSSIEWLVAGLLLMAGSVGATRLLGRMGVSSWLLFVIAALGELVFRNPVSTLPMPWKAAASLGLAFLVAGIPLFPLRRAGVAWPLTLGVGGGLSLLLGILVDLPFRLGPLPVDNRFGQAFAISLWAVLLTRLVTRRRGPAWGGEPGAGAGVPARPAPEAPPALTTRAS